MILWCASSISWWDGGRHWSGWCHVLAFLLWLPISLHYSYIYLIDLWYRLNDITMPNHLWSAVWFLLAEPFSICSSPSLLSHSHSTLDGILLVSSYFTLTHGTCRLWPSTCLLQQANGHSWCVPSPQTTSVQIWVRDENGESKCQTVNYENNTYEIYL